MIWDAIGDKDSETTRWACVELHAVLDSEALNNKATANSVRTETSIAYVAFTSHKLSATYAWIGFYT